MSTENGDETTLVADIPSELPILPLRNTVAYPFAMIPLIVGIPRSVKLVDEALKGDRMVGLVAMKDPAVEEPQPGEVYEMGTIAKLDRVTRGSDNSLQVIVQGLERFRVEHWVEVDPYLRAEIRAAPDLIENDVEVDALQRSLREVAREVIELSLDLLSRRMPDYELQITRSKESLVVA